MSYAKRAECWRTISYLLDNPSAVDYKQRLAHIEELALNCKDSYMAYMIATRIKHANVAALQNIIVNSEQSSQIIEFARHFPDYTSSMEDAIVKLAKRYHNASALARFAGLVPNSNKERLIAIIIDSNNAAAYYNAIRYIDNCDPEPFKDLLIKSKKPRYIFELAKKSTSQEEIDLLQDLIINAKSDMYVRLFAKYIKGADIQKLETRIIATKSVTEMRRFMQAVPQALRVKKLSSLF